MQTGPQTDITFNADPLAKQNIELNVYTFLQSKGYFSLNDFYAWAACNGQNSKE